MTAARAAGLAFPWPEPPGPGEATEIAPGILWARLPLPMRLDHVNVYLLDEGDHWTAVDTGLDWTGAREGWERLHAGPLAGRPVGRVLVTHHHPDHVGLAGWFAARGAEVWTTRTAWLYARMLTLDHHERPTAEHIAFRRRAGMPEDLLAAYAAERPFNFSACVAPIPLGFRAVEEGEQIPMAGRCWTVRLGHGHAPAQATLWSEDGLVIAGDQVLPGISPNVSVYPTEPEADPLGAWLASCQRLASHARPGDLALSGHKLPFRGLPFRLAQLAEHHRAALDRLEAALSRAPMTAADAFPALFARPIGAGEYGLALGEAVAHMTRLCREGRARREPGPGGAWLYCAA